MLPQSYNQNRIKNVRNTKLIALFWMPFDGLLLVGPETAVVKTQNSRSNVNSPPPKRGPKATHWIRHRVKQWLIQDYVRLSGQGQAADQASLLSRLLGKLLFADAEPESREPEICIFPEAKQGLPLFLSPDNYQYINHWHPLQATAPPVLDEKRRSPR
jgi:hypothetical protein